MASNRAMWARLRQLQSELADDGPVVRMCPGLVVVAEPRLARAALADRESRLVADTAFFRSTATGALPADLRRRLASELRTFLNRVPVAEVAGSIVAELSVRDRVPLPDAGPRLQLEALLPWLAPQPVAGDTTIVTAVRRFVDEIVTGRLRTLPGRRHRRLLPRLAADIGPLIDSSAGSADLLGVIAPVLRELPRDVVAEVYLRIITAFVGAPGAALAWCLHALATQPPDALDRGTGRQVALELLRLWPPGWQIGRLAATDHCLVSVHVDSGETVVAATYLMHRDRRWWNEPDRFDPGRWAGNPRPPAYLPFGLGPSMCIGAGFSVDLLAAIIEQLREGTVAPVAPATGRPHLTQLLSPPRSAVQCHHRPAAGRDSGS